jgi:hypothetical protein
MPRKAKYAVDKGNRNVRKTIKALTEQGFRAEKVEYRSRFHTHDLFGLFDVLAINEKVIRLIQVKSNAWPSKEHAAAMREFVCPENVIKECWRWESHIQKPRIMLYTKGDAAEL